MTLRVLCCAWLDLFGPRRKISHVIATDTTFGLAQSPLVRRTSQPRCRKGRNRHAGDRQDRYARHARRFHEVDKRTRHFETADEATSSLAVSLRNLRGGTGRRSDLR